MEPAPACAEPDYRARLINNGDTPAMSAPTLSLESLRQYSEEQTSKINLLISDLAFHNPLPRLGIWAEFRHSLWGKGLSHLRDPIYTTGQSVVQGPQVIPQALGLPGRKILVRSEYEQAEQAILSANENGRDAFIVSGNPGIGSPPPFSSSVVTSSIGPNLESGKSIFLVWLLMRRLVLRLPTAIQVYPHFAILFHEGGISQFSDLQGPDTYGVLDFGRSCHKNIWVLVDSNQYLVEPASIFRDHGPFFVIEAISPSEKRREWTKKVARVSYYMKTWTLEEVLQASVIHYLTLHSGSHFL